MKQCAPTSRFLSVASYYITKNGQTCSVGNLFWWAYGQATLEHQRKNTTVE
jgi:hypothetical protein